MSASDESLVFVPMKRARSRSASPERAVCACTFSLEQRLELLPELWDMILAHVQRIGRDDILTRVQCRRVSKAWHARDPDKLAVPIHPELAPQLRWNMLPSVFRDALSWVLACMVGWRRARVHSVSCVTGYELRVILEQTLTNERGILVLVGHGQLVYHFIEWGTAQGNAYDTLAFQRDLGEFHHTRGTMCYGIQRPQHLPPPYFSVTPGRRHV